MLKEHQKTDKRRNNAIYGYWLKHKDERGAKAYLAEKYNISRQRIKVILDKYEKQPIDKKI